MLEGSKVGVCLVDSRRKERPGTWRIRIHSHTSLALTSGAAADFVYKWLEKCVEDTGSILLRGLPG